MSGVPAHAKTGAKKAKGGVTKKRPYGKISRTRSVAYAKKPESKHVDLAGATYNVDTTGSVTLVATIPQGNTQVSRVGKKIILDSIQARGYFIPPTTPGSPGNMNKAAIIFVYDKRPTGALPAVTDILVSASSSAMNNDDNAGRFKILRRIDRYLSQGVAQGDIDAYGIDDWFSLNSKLAVYKSVGTGAITDFEMGALYMVVVGNLAAGATAGSVAVVLRTRFHEEC